MKKLFAVLVLSFSFSGVMAEYKVPPSHSSRSSGGVISDKQMEQCVILYNQILQLEDELNRTVVNRYSEYSVNSYNNKVRQHSNYVARYNAQCANKQSRSACEQANKLNRANGLPETPCR